MRVFKLAAFSVTGFLVAGAFAAVAPADDRAEPNVLDPLLHRSDRYVPKTPGTKERLRFYFGPYTIPPGWDANRLDLDVPLASGMIVAIEPGMRRVHDGGEPTHQEAHIHHAHWFGLDPGNEEDNYTFGFTEWIFGNGDEETKANFQKRSRAEPGGPIYGQYIGADRPQPFIYMLHNKTAQALPVYIVLDVTFIHGTLDELNALGGRPYHDVSGVLFGHTFDVPRDPDSKDGTYETAEDDPRGVIEWKSTVDGTLIGTGGHVHPGGLGVTVENYGSEQRPCPDDGRGYGGTLLLQSDARWHHDVPYSEDFQMEVSHPAFRAPIHKGDRIRISGTYENKRHGWYQTMTHEGLYIDEAQPPRGRCKPRLVGPAAKRDARAKRKGDEDGRIDPTEGFPNRPWSHHSTDRVCGRRFGAPPCEPRKRPYRPGAFTDSVSIANFLYMPGDFTMSGETPRVRQNTGLTVVNADQMLGIRHSVTTCEWPCNGPYVANYPLADGFWDSGTLGYDLIDRGSANPVAKTPANLPTGKYAYFCRIHPWMRGGFKVVK